jgi:hypothetical protein
MKILFRKKSCIGFPHSQQLEMVCLHVVVLIFIQQCWAELRRMRNSFCKGAEFPPSAGALQSQNSAFLCFLSAEFTAFGEATTSNWYIHSPFPICLFSGTNFCFLWSILAPGFNSGTTSYLSFTAFFRTQKLPDFLMDGMMCQCSGLLDLFCALFVRVHMRCFCSAVSFPVTFGWLLV